MFAFASAFNKHLTKSVKPAAAAAISGVSGRPILTGAPACKIEWYRILNTAFLIKLQLVLILEMTNQIYPVPLVRSLQGINNNNSNRTSHCTLISNSKPINERAEIAAFSGVYTTTPLGWRWEKRTHYLYKNNDMDTREKKRAVQYEF